MRERLERLGRGRIRREARKRTWRSENFFSSSRVRLVGGKGLVWVAIGLERGGFILFWGKGGEERVELPLLDFVEAREEGDRDEDDDCFFAVADFELWGLNRELVSIMFLGNS